MIDAHLLQLTPDEPPSAFSLEKGVDAANSVSLLVSPPGSRMVPAVIWGRAFDTAEDRQAFLSKTHSPRTDLAFLGRLTMIFGGGELDALSDRIVLDARDARRKAEEEAADLASKHLLVNLYAPDTKRGHALELCRKSRTEPDWKVVYDRAAERDRLCDWLRWQKPRFLAFLDHAAAHGNEDLTRLLTDEMFETERRVKHEGRGAGGNRPLRMWRGD
ncbi:MAG: hypothetical protein ACRYFW_12685 [Janthinobacterium lividum]